MKNPVVCLHTPSATLTQSFDNETVSRNPSLTQPATVHPSFNKLLLLPAGHLQPTFVGSNTELFTNLAKTNLTNIHDNNYCLDVMIKENNWLLSYYSLMRV